MLEEEIDNADLEGRLSEPVTYNEPLRLPNLQAVLKEAMRLHPSTGFTMARTVPKGGVTLLGHTLPEGVCIFKDDLMQADVLVQTTVGINSWVAHRNQSVFGDEIEAFVPERWLQPKEAVAKMDRYFLEVTIS